MSVWSYESNSDGVFTDFTNDLNKDIYKCKGNFYDDYNQICKDKNIIPCPFFQYNQNEYNIKYLRLANVKPDLSSWRAFLLALSSSNSNIEELHFHSIELSPQHISNLVQSVKKVLYIKSLKIEYFVKSTEFTDEQYNEAFKGLFSNDIIIDYLSFKGSVLGNYVINSFISQLSTSITIKILNLSYCSITDSDISLLVTSLRTNLSLEIVSLNHNQITGEILTNILEINNSIATSNDININNQLLKKSNEINKKIKDYNKKRKNISQNELSDVNISNELIIKVDNQQILKNTKLQLLDLSYNPILVNYLQNLQNHSNNIIDNSNEKTSSKLKIKLKGLDNFTNDGLTSLLDI